MEDNIYDLLVLGAGPGGLTAGIYAKRAGLNVAIIDKGLPGGVINNTHEVSNYTGFTAISGMDLAEKMYQHALSFNIPFIFDEIKRVYLDGETKVIECFGGEYRAKSIIIALGAEVRKLNVEGEKSFIGKGVSYCATCDGNLYKDATVAIVGGGNTALEDCLYLSNIAKKVYLIHRRDQFSGQQYLVDRLKERNNIELMLNSNVTQIFGDNNLNKVEIANKQTGEKRDLELKGLFICVGRGPDTGMIDMPIEKNSAGYIMTDENMRTNIEGVYAIGDIRNTPLKQIITAASDGAIAATRAFEYIKLNKKS